MSYPADLLPDLKATLGKGVSEVQPEPVLLGYLTDSADAIARYCRRTFVVPASATPRRFDAGVSALLAIDDLLDEPAPVVALLSGDGPPLVVDVDYQLLPYNLTELEPSYCQIRLLNPTTGQPQPWHTAALEAGRPTTGEVRITGKWAYAATVPGTITRMTVRGATRLYHQRLQRHTDSAGGNDDTGRTPVPQGWIEQDDVMTGFLRYYRKGY